MEPYRAFISDRLPKSQLARGFLTQSLFIGAGAVLANLSMFVFQKIIAGATAARRALLGLRLFLARRGVHPRHGIDRHGQRPRRSRRPKRNSPNCAPSRRGSTTRSATSSRLSR